MLNQLCNKYFDKLLIILFGLLYISGRYFGIELLFCPFYKLTHLYCPACGITRMILSILSLDFYQAFRYNPLMFVLLPFIIIYLIVRCYEIVSKKKIINDKVFDNICIILIVILILFGIMRNFSMFDYFVPTKI